MKTIGIDFGLKRVGLALSNSEGSFAFPFKVIERTTREALFEELLTIIEQEKVEEIVLGLPLSLDGEDTLTTRQVRNFAQSLGRRTTLPINFVDERFSSITAEEELKEAGRWNRKTKKSLDSQAATVILRTWLEKA